MLLTIQSTLIIPRLCSSSRSQFQFFLFYLSGEFPSKVSQSHLQAENKTLIWLFSDVASIGLPQKVICKMLWFLLSVLSKTTNLCVWKYGSFQSLPPHPQSSYVRMVSSSHADLRFQGSKKGHSLFIDLLWAWTERRESQGEIQEFVPHMGTVFWVPSRWAVSLTFITWGTS